MNDNHNDSDMVNHPPHYTNGPELGRLECIEVRRWMPSGLADAFKYVWREGKKIDAIQDLQKALFYLDDWNTLSQFHRMLYPGIITAVSFFEKARPAMLDTMPKWQVDAMNCIVYNDVNGAKHFIQVGIETIERSSFDA